MSLFSRSEISAFRAFYVRAAFVIVSQKEAKHDDFRRILSRSPLETDVVHAGRLSANQRHRDIPAFLQEMSQDMSGGKRRIARCRTLHLAGDKKKLPTRKGQAPIHRRPSPGAPPPLGLAHGKPWGEVSLLESRHFLLRRRELPVSDFLCQWRRAKLRRVGDALREQPVTRPNDCTASPDTKATGREARRAGGDPDQAPNDSVFVSSHSTVAVLRKYREFKVMDSFIYQNPCQASRRLPQC